MTLVVCFVQDLAAELTARLIVVRQSGREEESHAPTDRWTEEASTAGQRAIHIGWQHKGWAIVPPTGLQRQVAVASTHLKQNLQVHCSALDTLKQLSAGTCGCD